MSDVGEPCRAMLERTKGAQSDAPGTWLVDCALNAGHGPVHETAAGQKFGAGLVAA
ncbi:hypothetical protein [Rhodococcus sp. 06-156-3C]|uniref:hypothetical protein n=1 Tax=Rhodococcus sp. 06-156-3C TaxID=2022486 RepID=UPI0015951B58|nr:hypothetical protein [Rhodococcus sp. 06-156-3C]